MLGCIRILLLLLGGNNSEIPMIRLYIYNIDEVDLDLRSSTVSRAMGARYLWLPDLWGPQCVGKCQGGVVGARRGGEGRGYLGTRWRSAMVRGLGVWDDVSSGNGDIRLLQPSGPMVCARLHKLAQSILAWSIMQVWSLLLHSRSVSRERYLELIPSQIACQIYFI